MIFSVRLCYVMLSYHDNFRKSYLSHKLGLHDLVCSNRTALALTTFVLASSKRSVSVSNQLAAVMHKSPRQTSLLQSCIDLHIRQPAAILRKSLCPTKRLRCEQSATMSVIAYLGQEQTPQPNFFNGTSWLTKNSAEIRLSRIYA